MHPAYSIIFFTVASGLGYGLAAVLGLGILDPSVLPTKIAHFIALGLISLGLLSSTLHLGNPQRAWRAFSQWRSSWLSCEGVMAILTFVPLCANAWLAIFEDRTVAWIGLSGSISALITVFCTSMIYASLKSIHAWYTPLTSLAFLVFAAAGGLSLTCVFAAISGDLSDLLIIETMAALGAAWVVKTIWRNHLKREKPPSTPQTATGLGAIGKVRLLERPHGNENYLTREMGYRIARKHADKLAILSLAFGCVIPVAILFFLVLGDGIIFSAPALTAVALASHILGIVTERWLFFAEARHAVMNYY